MKDLCLFLLVACLLSAVGCRQYADGEVLDLRLCVGADFEPIDECAGALCSAEKILHDLQQKKKAEAEIAEAERAVEELSGSYEQCCLEDGGGDTGLGFTTKPKLINMAAEGSVKDPIGGIGEPNNPVTAKIAFLGCFRSQVSFGIEAVELNFYGVDVIIHNIYTDGTFVATSDAVDVGSMTISFEAEVAVNLDELGLASDILSFTLTTDALGGARFTLDESGKASGRLVLKEPIKATPDGAFEEYKLDLRLVMTIEGLEDPFL